MRLEGDDAITIAEYDSANGIVVRHAVLRRDDIVYNTGKYTAEELNAMDQDEIIELAANLEYDIAEAIEEGTKAAIIAAFLEAQEAAG